MTSSLLTAELGNLLNAGSAPDVADACCAVAPVLQQFSSAAKAVPTVAPVAVLTCSRLE
jgi:hypothetical protein